MKNFKKKLTLTRMKIKIILKMKQEITNNNEMIKTINDKCENLETKLTEQTKENEKLADVAGKMFLMKSNNTEIPPPRSKHIKTKITIFI